MGLYFRRAEIRVPPPGRVRGTTPSGASRPRIAVIGPGAETPGGIWTVTTTLIDSELSGAFDMRHIPTHRDGGVRGKLDAAATGLGTLAKEMRAGRVDLVWAHVSADAAFWRKSIALGLARAFRVPFVLHVHGSRFAVWYDAASKPEQAAARAVLRRADLVVTLSPTWERRLREIADCRTAAIMNPVVIPPPADEAARIPGRIVCFGRLGERKGSRVLVQALARVVGEGLEASLLLAGDGDRAPVEEEARRLGVADRVEIRSWIEPAEVARLLDTASIFALPSQNEGLPVALLEAMAHGLPCVVTPVGGIPDLVTDGRDGLMVQPDDPEGLADAIAGLLRDAGRRAAIAPAGPAEVERRCALPVVAAQFEAALTGVLARRPAR